MKDPARRGWIRFLPLQGIRPLSAVALPGDALAGLTLAALAIPEVMGYTRISQTPVVTGLYTLLAPAVAFALLGSSRHLVVAADSATAAILAATLVGVAAPGSAAYLAFTSLVALLVAVMLALAAMLRLGFLADFLSRSALIGLLSGIGVQVAAGELGGLLGLEKQGHDALRQLVSVFTRLHEIQPGALLLTALVLAMIGACQRWAPRLPGPLLAVTAAVLISWALDLEHHGIAVVGRIPGGLPTLELPPLDGPQINQCLITAASCFVVIIAQSAATARAYAQRYEERCDENLDLIGLAGANLLAALSGTFVVNGSPTKTEMVDEAGGRSQIAQLAMALTVLLVLLFLTGPLGLLPSVVLSTIVFLIGLKLIDLAGIRELYRLQRNEFLIAMLTAITVALVGVTQGIVLAVLLSLIDQVRHSYRPRTRLWTPDDQGELHTVPVAPGVFAAPGVVAYRFEADLFYANAGRFLEEVLALISATGAGPGEAVKGLVIDASGIDTVDYSAGKTLQRLQEIIRRRGLLAAMVLESRGLLRDLAPYGFATDMPVHRRVIDAVEDLSRRLTR